MPASQQEMLLLVFDVGFSAAGALPEAIKTASTLSWPKLVTTGSFANWKTSGNADVPAGPRQARPFACLRVRAKTITNKEAKSPPRRDVVVSKNHYHL